MTSTDRATSPAGLGDGGLVVVGYTKFLLDHLSDLVPARTVTVLEEPDVIARRRLESAREWHACVRQIIPVTYQNAIDFRIDEPPLSSVCVPGAVLPGSEYAVPAAAVLAETWGLPGAGPRAAHTLRNKDLLRARADGYLSQPAWLCPEDEDELVSFATKHRGSVVIKPSNGQASAGVRLCDSIADVVRAQGDIDGFREDVLRSDSIAPARLLAEARLYGPEFSVECFVQDGEIVFCSITAKYVAAGEHPVELGHVVPADLELSLERKLLGAVERLVRIVRVRTSVLHSEWIIQEGEPNLVECAGRLPGDNITALISEAWGFNFINAWVCLLSGQRPQVPSNPRGAAAIWFLKAPYGTVSKVEGVDDAVRITGVSSVDIAVKPGDSTSELRSSWSRDGHVMAVGPRADVALSASQRAAEAVRIVVE